MSMQGVGSKLVCPVHKIIGTTLSIGSVVFVGSMVPIEVMLFIGLMVSIGVTMLCCEACSWILSMICCCYEVVFDSFHPRFGIV